jgi:hydroxymethylpyrimidine/phosphomethylpyrimidine kinase
MIVSQDNHTQTNTNIPRALTIAGSDSGGGAGIQADLKTFAALGVYGLSALTAVTAQNTQGVRGVQELRPELIEAQINAVLEDIGTDTAKTGMLSSALIIEAVARCVSKWKLRLVVDPVMVAKGGDPLLAPAAIQTLSTLLLPLAEVITPNIPEAEVLTGQSVKTLDDMRAAAKAIHALGPQHVIVKGGHYNGDPVDIYFDGERVIELYSERIQTRHTHGTGCTFSAAIAAFMAKNMPVGEAVANAKTYITEAIRYAPGLGHGHGPVEHFWRIRKEQAEGNKHE